MGQMLSPSSLGLSPGEHVYVHMLICAFACVCAYGHAFTRLCMCVHAWRVQWEHREGSHSLLGGSAGSSKTFSGSHLTPC